MSEKIQHQHLERKVVLYIRQSSAHQVSHNTESRRLQYAMQQRLRKLGWQEIEIVDEDLGRSAAGMAIREGFERMVAEVCLGKVGAVAAREVSRFARNSREWQQLVEVCRVVDTLLVDQETVYSPRQSNDRLLLGLKGSLNEYELDLLRQRSVEARYEKARRGELVVAAPVGYLKSEGGVLEKDPDRRVQEAILLLFAKFVELGSGRQALLWFIEQGLQLPARLYNGPLIWKRPSYSMVYRMLNNPVYAGAYAYGKTESRVHYENGRPRQVARCKPMDQWLALIPDRHEGYISWERFEKNQQMLSENQTRQHGAGAPKSGQALLGGLLRCARCGRKLMVIYSGYKASMPRYACQRGNLDNGEPKCIAFGGRPVDEAVTRQVLAVVRPGAVQAAVRASRQEEDRKDEVLHALERDLEALRYRSERAWKQYDAADPENRLVAEELEHRWNQALEEVHQLQIRIDEHRSQHPQMEPGTLEEFQDLAGQLEEVWNHPNADVRLKKRIVRTLIQEVVVNVDAEGGEIILVIHWKGGIHTELHLPRRRRGHSSGHTSKDIVEAVRHLVRVCSDDLIAGVLNRHGLRTGRRNRWTRERVASLRNKKKIMRYCPEKRQREGWMNLTAAAELLGICSRTLRLAVERGEIPGEHPLAEGPWVFLRADLEGELAQKLVTRVRMRNGAPAVPPPEQSTFEFSST